MKNAFTLIELVGVIAMLSVIALVAVPAINNSLSKSRNNLSEVQKNQIIKGGKDYLSEHINKLPSNNEDCIKLPLTGLRDAGYINEDTINPEDDKEYSENYYVKVTKVNNSYSYELKKINNSKECTLIEVSSNE